MPDRLCCLSFDDGSKEDAVVAKILRDLGVPATFFLISNRLDKLDLSWYEGHEIGSHTVSHPHMHRLDIDKTTAELYQSKRDIEIWTGRTVAGFSYPYGQFTHRQAGMVQPAGYEYGRTFAIDPENAYYIPDPFMWPVSWYFHAIHQDHTLPLLKARKPIHIAGHGYHFDRESRLQELRCQVSQLRDLKYEIVTCREFVRRCRESK